VPPCRLDARPVRCADRTGHGPGGDLRDRPGERALPEGDLWPGGRGPFGVRPREGHSASRDRKSRSPPPHPKPARGVEGLKIVGPTPCLSRSTAVKRHELGRGVPDPVTLCLGRPFVKNVKDRVGGCVRRRGHPCPASWTGGGSEGPTSAVVMLPAAPAMNTSTGVMRRDARGIGLASPGTGS
jgi:hypothetical protein